MVHAHMWKFHANRRKKSTTKKIKGCDPHINPILNDPPFLIEMSLRGWYEAYVSGTCSVVVRTISQMVYISNG